jgi:hypothetical protein
MYIFRLIVAIALLTSDFSSDVKPNENPNKSTDGIVTFDPCLLGSWRVDIESMSIALERPVSGSILITFEESPTDEITSSFDVTLTRRPPQSATKRRVHTGSLSATMVHLRTHNNAGRFKLINVELGEENSHKRYKADGDWRDLDKEEIKAFFRKTTWGYKDCTATMMLGMYNIKLVKETY